MTLLTEPSYPIPHISVSVEGGGSGSSAVLDFQILPTQVEWMRFCEPCNSEQRFVAGWICDAGLIGCCSVCGAESVARFTRTNSEVA